MTPPGFIEPTRWEGKPLPRPREARWHRYLVYYAWAWLTWWPWEVRRLKREGFVRVGWMTWATPGPVHEPGCVYAAQDHPYRSCDGAITGAV